MIVRADLLTLVYQISYVIIYVSSSYPLYYNNWVHVKEQYALVIKKQTKKYKEKFVILQWIGIVVIKSKEIRVAIYTCIYSVGHLIPIIQSCQYELGIKYPLESRWPPLFPYFTITMNPIDCKITNFPYTCEHICKVLSWLFLFCIGRRIPIISSITRNLHLPTSGRYVI